MNDIETAAAPAAEIAPARWRVLLAFAIIYVVWGSTYLAIRFAIETLPAFLMAGTRFLIAGGVLYAWARYVGGAERPSFANWRACAIVGIALIVGGNGLVVWAEYRVPSGVAALLIGIEPCFIVFLDWLRPGGTRPGVQVVLGLVLGIAGLFFLIGPDSLMGGGRIDLLGAVVLLVAGLSWAAGSLYSRHGSLPRSPVLATAMQMLAGGVVMTLGGALHGDLGAFDASTYSVRSVASWAYLVVFGSIVAFTAYAWLLRVCSPAQVSTYAYANPIVAVLLGWAFANETLTVRMMVAAAVIVGGIALITLAPKDASAH
jgi:drug/metabolite transporter (DMT)-like permease